MLAFGVEAGDYRQRHRHRRHRADRLKTRSGRQRLGRDQRQHDLQDRPSRAASGIRRGSSPTSSPGRSRSANHLHHRRGRRQQRGGHRLVRRERGRGRDRQRLRRARRDLRLYLGGRRADRSTFIADVRQQHDGNTASSRRSTSMPRKSYGSPFQACCSLPARRRPVPGLAGATQSSNVIAGLAGDDN